MQKRDFTCYPVPGMSFHIYETSFTEAGRFDQKFVPPGIVIIARAVPIAGGGTMSIPVQQLELAAGQTHRISLGPIPDRAKEARKNRK